MTKDENKTKEQLIDELAQLRQRVTELGKLKVEHKQTEKVLRESEDWRPPRSRVSTGEEAGLRSHYQLSTRDERRKNCP